MTEDVAAVTTPAPAAGRKLGRSAVRFVIASAVSFGMNLGLAVVLHEIVGLSEELAYAISLAVAFVTSFLLMRYYVYPGGAAGAGAGAGGGAKPGKAGSSDGGVPAVVSSIGNVGVEGRRGVAPDRLGWEAGRRPARSR